MRIGESSGRNGAKAATSVAAMPPGEDALLLHPLAGLSLPQAPAGCSGDQLAEVSAPDQVALFQTRVLAVAAAQELEREYLALEVHDRIAQTLSVLSQSLGSLEVRLQAAPEARLLAAHAAALCRDALREARNIMTDLQPPLLDDFGLVHLMKEELRRFGRDTGCRVLARLSYPFPLPREAEIALYRIFREALINIQKHAGATQVVVLLACASGEARLSVQDNGIGFSVSDALKYKRVGGLVSMQRRAQLAGGLCRIESRRGDGTRVGAWIPFAVATARQAARQEEGVRSAA